MNQLNIFNEVHKEKRNIIGEFPASHPWFYINGNLPIPVKQVPVGESEYSRRLDGPKSSVIANLLESTMRYRITLIEYLRKLLQDELVEGEIDSCGLEFIYCQLMSAKGLALTIGSDPERFSSLDSEQLVNETLEFPIVTESKEVIRLVEKYNGLFSHKYLSNIKEVA